MLPQKLAYESMGTTWEISIWDQIKEDAFTSITSEITNKSHEFDNTYSRFIKNSFVSKISHKTGKIKVPEEFIQILQLYFKLYDLSEKKLTPFIGHTLEELGYDADYSLISQKKINKVPDLFETVKIIDTTTIKVKEPVLFDFGAVGKGFLVDTATSFLKEKGVKRFLVNGSGDISYVSNDKEITVGLENPLNTTQIIGTIKMKYGCMCSSATNRRAWGKYNHIIYPQTLSSPKEIIASWVIADSAALADGLATALFMVPPENFSINFQFEYCILNKDLQVKRSSGFHAQLFGKL